VGFGLQASIAHLYFDKAKANLDQKGDEKLCFV